MLLRYASYAILTRRIARASFLVLQSDTVSLRHPPFFSRSLHIQHPKVTSTLRSTTPEDVHGLRSQKSHTRFRNVYWR